jgi:hypothetical protein
MSTSRNAREGHYLGKWRGQPVRSRYWHRLAPGFRFGPIAALSELLSREDWHRVGRKSP